MRSYAALRLFAEKRSAAATFASTSVQSFLLFRVYSFVLRIKLQIAILGAEHEGGLLAPSVKVEVIGSKDDSVEHECDLQATVDANHAEGTQTFLFMFGTLLVHNTSNFVQQDSFPRYLMCYAINAAHLNLGLPCRSSA